MNRDDEEGRSGGRSGEELPGGEPLLPTWGQVVRTALWRGFWRRSFSFYMLLTMPLVLMLALPLLMKQHREE